MRRCGALAHSQERHEELEILGLVITFHRNIFSRAQRGNRMRDWKTKKKHGIHFIEAGSGPLFVLYHGGAGSHTHWTRNIEALSQKFTVRALDLPGYGNSDPTNKEYSALEYIKAMVPKMNALTDDVGRFHLMGFSFGGALAAGIAAELGHRVEKLTLVAPGGFGNPIGRTLDMRRLPKGDLNLPEVRETLRHNLLQMMINDEANIEEDTLLLQLANSRRTGFNSAKLSLSDLTPGNIEKATAKIQLIWGDADKLAHPSPQDRARLIREVKPEIQAHFVRGGGHWVAYECPKVVNALVLNFHTN